jgi:uncharacterized damage-inducible protein DinB
MMHAYHRRMFAFDHWATSVSRAAVAPYADRVPKSLAWLNHILGAKRIWLARVTATAAPFGVNPAFGVADLAGELDQARDGWSRCFEALGDADITRVVHYKNLKGDPFQSPLGDILAHVPMHGQHHRGQINADLRAAGLAPPVIDFIHAARSGAID